MTSVYASFSLLVDKETVESLSLGVLEVSSCPSHDEAKMGPDTKNTALQLGNNNQDETDDGA